jgi:hypothetical protein
MSDMYKNSRITVITASSLLFLAILVSTSQIGSKLIVGVKIKHFIMIISIISALVSMILSIMANLSFNKIKTTNSDELEDNKKTIQTTKTFAIVSGILFIFSICLFALSVFYKKK